MTPICSKCKFLSKEQVRFRPCPRIPIIHRDMLCSNPENAIKDYVGGEPFSPFCEEVNRHGECLVFYPADLESPELAFEEGTNTLIISSVTKTFVVTTDGQIPNKTMSYIFGVYDENTEKYIAEITLEHSCTVKASCVIADVVSVPTELYCEIPDIPEIEFDKTTNTVTIKSYNLVRYTTDGSKVTDESPEYEKPFVIDHNTTIKARSYTKDDYSVQVSTYCISIEPPVIEFDPDTNKVTLTADDPILYTTDGSDVFDDSTQYDEPFELTKNTLVKAACIVEDELSETTELECKVVNDPVITYDEDTHKVTIESENLVRYTTDGSDVKKSSPLYITPFEITETCTVKAVEFVDDKESSQVELECIFISAPEISFDPENNIVSISGDNTILYSTDGSKIYDDSDEYTDPFVIEKNTTVRAACILNGKLSEEVSLVCKVASTPKISYNPATKTVTISGENTILYTTDGSDVKKKDAEYKSPFKIIETKTIKAKSIVDDRMSEQAELTCVV